MPQKQFGLMFQRDVENQYTDKKYALPKDGFDTTSGCLKWAYKKSIPAYHLYVTEYDLGSIEADGTFAIVEQTTLEEFE